MSESQEPKRNPDQQHGCTLPVMVVYSVNVRGELIDKQEDAEDFISNRINDGGIEDKIRRLSKIVSRLLLHNVNAGLISADDLADLMDDCARDHRYIRP